MRNKDESRLQQACVRWFDLQYPQRSKLLFAVPNGGSRNEIEAAKMKREGVRAGVSDLIFLTPSGTPIFLEFKTIKGKQSENQKAWETLVKMFGYEYYIIRDFEEFERIINENTI